MFADEPYSFVGDLSDDDEVHDIFVQVPAPDHVDDRTVLRHIGPAKDIGGLHLESAGRLVAGDTRSKPCTPHDVQKLLVAVDVETKGAGVIVIGRSDIVGKLMVNLLIQKTEGGNITVTVCHSRTGDLAAKTHETDIVVTAVGVPELVTDDMLSEGIAVIDAGVDRVDVDDERDYGLVGDVELDSVKEKASAITPVPGGTGPMTRAVFL